MSDKKKYKILVADDNKVNLKVADFILRPIAELLDFAMNGRDVLDKIKLEKYDFILMDVKMPVMDGYEATKQIRAIEASENSEPQIIIAITANNQPEEAEYCKNIGMNGHVAKPFVLNDILAIIETL